MNQNVNPGLRGRFGPEFKLQDYTPHDLAAILRVVVKRKGLLLASSLSDDDLAGLFGRVPKAVIAQYNGSFWQLSFCAVAYHPHGRVVLWCVWGSILVSSARNNPPTNYNPVCVSC
jgi:hypothetical protein